MALNNRSVNSIEDLMGVTDMFIHLVLRIQREPCGTGCCVILQRVEWEPGFSQLTGHLGHYSRTAMSSRFRTASNRSAQNDSLPKMTILLFFLLSCVP